MAALDYGMALSRGLIAPQKELQAEMKELAGTAFKSDDWWNKQLDRQIKQGISETKTRTQVVGPDRKDLTTGQLRAIQTQAEQSADKVKREARLAKSKTKRGARGSGGLLGKSTQQDKGLSAKLPELGSMGLGIEKTYLG